MSDERKYYTLAESIELIRLSTGQTFDLSTIRRWRRLGRAGVRLRAVKIGSRWMTTPAWIEQFFESATDAELAAESIAHVEALKAKHRRPTDPATAARLRFHGVDA